MKRAAQFSLIAVLASLAGAGGAALADEMTPSASTDLQDVRGQSVTERARPGYDAVGIRAGAFMVYPKMDVTENYNDNIYATENQTKSDFITQVAPSIAVNSLWSRHALNLHAGVDQYWYLHNSGENRFDYHVGADGRLDILRDTNVTGAASYAQLHEDRGLPTSPASAAEPTEYKLFDSKVALNQAFNRITTSLIGTYDNYDYDDVAKIGGGTIDQSFRNRNEYTGSLKLGYLVSPDTSIYTQGTLNKRDYTDTTIPGTDRSSDGYAVVVGSDFKLSRLAQGGIFVGYQSQSYDNPAFSDISGVAYGADVNWFVTALTTVRVNASSTIQESTITGNSGYTAQQVDLGVDHELLRNVILSGDIGYEKDNFDGIGRKDDIYSGKVGVNYLLNEFFAVGLNYSLTDRNSNQTGDDYTRNVIGLTLRGQL
jgi:hypothetical protein